VRVLELVGIEDPERDQEDARDEERGGGEEDELDENVAPRFGRGGRQTAVQLMRPLGRPPMIVLSHTPHTSIDRWRQVIPGRSFEHEERSLRRRPRDEPR
jgi:hypothetical protein